MRLERVSGHAEFSIPVDHDRVRTCWEMWLDPGEELAAHQHRDNDEIFLIFSGQGQMTVAQQRALVTAGQFIFVPQGINHSLANDSTDKLHAFSVEIAGSIVTPEGQEKSSVGEIDDIMGGLPASMDEAQSIQHIVKLFDVGGKLSEQIEAAFGLDNRDGMNALEQVEKKIMRAVLEITRRYNTGNDSSKIFGHKRI